MGTSRLRPGITRSRKTLWRSEILKKSTAEKRDTIMRWLNDVIVHEYVDKNATGSSQGREEDSLSAQSSLQQKYRVMSRFEQEAWADSEMQKFVYQGSIAEWPKVADVSEQPRPRMVLPLGVEPDKPRLIYDARWFNLMCKHVPFVMDSVGKVAQCS